MGRIIFSLIFLAVALGDPVELVLQLFSFLPQLDRPLLPLRFIQFLIPSAGLLPLLMGALILGTVVVRMGARIAPVAPVTRVARRPANFLPPPMAEDDRVSSRTGGVAAPSEIRRTSG